MKALPASFFNRPTTVVAKDLIGCVLVRKRKIGGQMKTERFTVVETEAYDGEKDLGCHASRGRTKRTEVLYGKAGRIYIYFTYGMHWLLNFVAGPEGYPAGVLIRSIVTKEGERIIGPARITKRLGLDGRFHGLPASKKTGLWVEKSRPDKEKRFANRSTIKASPRIGIDYAGPVWSKKKWRFVLEF